VERLEVCSAGPEGDSPGSPGGPSLPGAGLPGSPPHMDRPGWYIGIHDWESLGKALEALTGVPGFEESLAKLRDFRKALFAWERRWNLAHPEPLSWAIQHFPIWAKAPVVAGKAISSA
jgi:hypothetical protein